jgi:hypothetical protein
MSGRERGGVGKNEKAEKKLWVIGEWFRRITSRKKAEKECGRRIRGSILAKKTNGRGVRYWAEEKEKE